MKKANLPRYNALENEHKNLLNKYRRGEISAGELSGLERDIKNRLKELRHEK